MKKTIKAWAVVSRDNGSVDGVMSGAQVVANAIFDKKGDANRYRAYHWMANIEVVPCTISYEVKKK